jgi:prepilin-type N-terminal cleavage/methylation domain-containing protein
MKISIFFKKEGFTLIELIVVFSIIALLSASGIAGFVTFSRSQTVTTTVQDVKNMLVAARSEAFAQVSSACPSGQIFNGTEVIFCHTLEFGSPVSCPQCLGNTDYEMDLLCGGTASPLILLQKKKLPAATTITVNQVIHQPFCPTFTFQPISGGVIDNGTITISAYGKSQTVTVSRTGVVQ